MSRIKGGSFITISVKIRFSYIIESFGIYIETHLCTSALKL